MLSRTILPFSGRRRWPPSSLTSLASDRARASPKGRAWSGPFHSDHPLKSRLGGSYLNVAASLLEEARERVVLVSPYVEARGVGLLFDRLAGALPRGSQ